jgi:hypothetical protein
MCTCFHFLKKKKAREGEERGRKEGRKKRRKEGKKEGRKERRKEFLVYYYYLGNWILLATNLHYFQKQLVYYDFTSTKYSLVILNPDTLK